MTLIARLRALGWFLLASAWYLFSDLVAMRAASGLNFGDLYEPLYRIFQLFLLIVGFSLMSLASQRGVRPRKSIGLEARPGRAREFALGAVLGWAGVVACVLPAALIGGLVFTLFTNPHQIGVVLLDLIAIAAGTLAIEVAFRGFPFRKLIDAMGPVTATFFLAVIYTVWRTHAAPTSTAAVLVSFLLGCVLSVAALRTRALWVGWGFHFAWTAAMSLLFGLPMAGGMNYSPILVTNALGPAWVTGGLQGPEGSAFGVLVAAVLVIVMGFATTELHYKYGFAEIVPGGIPVDIDEFARRQHEAAMAPVQPAEPQLVQIMPAQPAWTGARPATPPADPGALAPEAESSTHADPDEARLSEESLPVDNRTLYTTPPPREEPPAAPPEESASDPDAQR